MTEILFSSLYGQGKAKGLIGRSLHTGRIPHSFLFRGPEGVGKTQFAQALAATLNCPGRSPDSIDACGSCPSCRKYISDNHPDFQVVLPVRGAIKIDQIRELIKSLEYPPYEAALRVVVLEDVHTMRQEAANALLKTLEEPRQGNVLILTAAASQNLLSTISSRCQSIPFELLSVEDTARVLQKHEFSEDDAMLFAELSCGSPGQALNLKEQELVPLWQEVVTFLLDPSKTRGHDLLELLDLAEKMGELKLEVVVFFDLLRRSLRDLLLQDENALALYYQGERRLWRSEAIFAAQKAIDRAEQKAARNCNLRLVCEVLLFELQRFW